MPMLALVGSGEYLPAIEPVDRFLLAELGKEPRVVCLPTAAGAEGPERIAYWQNLGLDHFTRLGVQVETLPVIDQTSANNADFAERVRQANFIYLSGGRPDYLLRSLRNSLVWQAIQDVLAAGGLLAGCSAGAMIMGERSLGFPLRQKSFGLLPGAVIIPHYDEIPPRLTRFVRFLAGYPPILIGIEASTALFVNQGKSMAIGSGGVTVWTGKSKIRYTHGEHIPLPVGN